MSWLLKFLLASYLHYYVVNCLIHRPQMQQVAGQMKQSNPELFDQLRSHVQGAQQSSNDPSPNKDPPTTKSS